MSLWYIVLQGRHWFCAQTPKPNKTTITRQLATAVAATLYFAKSRYNRGLAGITHYGAPVLHTTHTKEKRETQRKQAHSAHLPEKETWPPTYLLSLLDQKSV